MDFNCVIPCAVKFVITCNWMIFFKSNTDLINAGSRKGKMQVWSAAAPQVKSKWLHADSKPCCVQIKANPSASYSYAKVGKVSRPHGSSDIHSGLQRDQTSPPRTYRPAEE